MSKRLEPLIQDLTFPMFSELSSLSPEISLESLTQTKKKTLFNLLFKGLGWKRQKQRKN